MKEWSRRDILRSAVAAGVAGMIPSENADAKEMSRSDNEMTPEQRRKEIIREADEIGKITDELETARKNKDTKREQQLYEEFRIRAERVLKLLNGR